MTKTSKNTEVTYEEIFTDYQAELLSTECPDCGEYEDANGETEYQFDSTCSCGSENLMPYTSVENEECCLCYAPFELWEDCAHPNDTVTLKVDADEDIRLLASDYVCLSCASQAIDDHNDAVAGKEER